jgi:hypothetical protein
MSRIPLVEADLNLGAVAKRLLLAVAAALCVVLPVTADQILLDNGATQLNVGTTPNDGTGDTIKLEAGGFCVLANPAASGWAVVNNTTDKLLLTNTSGAASAVIDVVIVGVGTIT